jgi:hypothetical protein
MKKVDPVQHLISSAFASSLYPNVYHASDQKMFIPVVQAASYFVFIF